MSLSHTETFTIRAIKTYSPAGCATPAGQKEGTNPAYAQTLDGLRPKLSEHTHDLYGLLAGVIRWKPRLHKEIRCEKIKVSLGCIHNKWGAKWKPIWRLMGAFSRVFFRQTSGKSGNFSGLKLVVKEHGNTIPTHAQQCQYFEQTFQSFFHWTDAPRAFFHRSHLLCGKMPFFYDIFGLRCQWHLSS